MNNIETLDKLLENTRKINGVSNILYCMAQDKSEDDHFHAKIYEFLGVSLTDIVDELEELIIDEYGKIKRIEDLNE
jgi:hypothetical protein